MRQMRVGLPDGIGALSDGQTLAPQVWERLEAEWVTNCIECGCCQFTCPADIPLLDFIRMGKQEVGALIRARAAAHATKK